MRRKTFSVLFFIKKSKLLKNGEAPIRLRITVEGRTCDVQIKRSVPVAQWNQAKECVKGNGRMVGELNNYISSIKVRLYQIHRELEESGKKITAERRCLHLLLSPTPAHVADRASTGIRHRHQRVCWRRIKAGC